MPSSRSSPRSSPSILLALACRTVLPTSTHRHAASICTSLSPRGHRTVSVKLKISGLKRYSPSLIERYNRSVEVGEPYSEDALLALQTALQETPYFGSVIVSLDRSKDEDSLVPGADGAEACADAGARPRAGAVPGVAGRWI